MASEATSILQSGRSAFKVKRVASIIQIMGNAATGFGWTPWNLYLFLVGVLGWLVVGVLWNDRALIWFTSSLWGRWWRGWPTDEPRGA